MIKFGEAQEKIANSQLDYANKLRADYISGLENALNELKELQQSRKKLESRRLDYNAKLNTVQRAKKEKPELEEQMRAAELKFNESMEDTYSRMIGIGNAEEMHMRQLAMFYNCELEYHQKSAEILIGIQDIFHESNYLNHYKSVRRSPSLARSKSHRAHFSSGHEGQEPTRIQYNHNYGDLEMPRTDSEPLEDMVPSNNGMNPSSAPSRILTRTSSFSIDRSSPSLPSHVNQRKQVRVLYDFDGDSKDELPIYKGDLVTVLDEIDNGWWVGELIDEHGRRVGMFPSNYVEEVGPAIPPPLNIHKKPYTAISNTTPQITATNIPPSYIHSNDNYFPIQAGMHAQSEPVSQRRLVPTSPSHYSSGSKPTLPSRVPTARLDPPKINHPPIPDRSDVLRSLPSNERTFGVNGSDQACRECGCTDYKANMFKQGSCNNCFHTH
ncbi:hypothetical protein K7432_013658 [Basidiobolus ranarum]